jgi:hypothetical protein
MDWYRSHGIPIRVVTGSDGQPVHVAELGSGPPPTAGSHTPTPAQPRYPPGHRDSSRQPGPPPIPSTQHLDPPHPYDRHQSSHNSYSHPPVTPSHLRSRSQGAHPPALQTPPSGYSHTQQVAPEATSPTYREYPPGYHSSDRERRGHRSNVYEPPPRLQPPTQPLAGSHSPSHSHSRSPTSSRGSIQVHNHQRMNVSNYGQPERDHERDFRDREREQDWDRERGQRFREREGNDVVHRGASPHYSSSRSRYPIDERESYTSHAREPRGYHHNDTPHGHHPAISRSLSPRSRSGSPPRRSPREMYYERDVSSARQQAHGSGVEMDMPPRRAPHGANSEGELERDVDMEDVRERAPEPAD